MGLKRLFSFLDFRASKQKEEEYEKLKKREGLEYINIGNLIFGSFFIIFSAVLVDFFLPFFLRDLGLSILEIGAYLTIGLALGTMFMTILFSQIQRNIALRSGLNYSTVFGFITSFVLYILPNTFGAILSSFSLKLRDITFDVSRDVTFHHNTREGTRRIVSSNYLIIQSIGFVLGLLFSLAFIKTLGFRNTFLIFAFLALPAFLIFSKIKEGTRFRPKINYKQPPVSRKLKLFLFSGIIYNFALSASFVLVITFLVTDYFSNSIEWIAYLYVGLYVSMGISSFITKKFLDKFSFIATAIFGMFIIFCSAIVIIFSRNLYVLLGAMILEGIGAGIWSPSHEAYYWKNTKPSLRETVVGYYWGWLGFFKTIGPLAGGFIVVAFNSFLAPFVLKAGVAVLSIVLYFSIIKMKD